MFAEKQFGEKIPAKQISAKKTPSGMTNNNRFPKSDKISHPTYCTPLLEPLERKSQFQLLQAMLVIYRVPFRIIF